MRPIALEVLTAVLLLNNAVSIQVLGDEFDPTWPEGSWALPMPMSGCPADQEFSWHNGYLYQDSENDDNDNQWSTNNHFPSVGEDFESHYCVKTEGGEGYWPAGAYCIYVKDGCPVGFSCGLIRWDDQDFDNKNYRNGTLPDGIYDSDTLIYYACRDDGPVDNEITLPATEPFYLFLYHNDCQKVKNTEVTVEWLKWDNERFTNMDRNERPHPVSESADHSHRLFYCYYTPKYSACPTVQGDDDDAMWPEGSWALPMPMSGCPVDQEFSWQHGYLYQDSENDDNDNQWSTPNHFPGVGEDFESHYCVKMQGGRGYWPAGNYCIYVKDGCPVGFSCGYIRWDDQDFDNKNYQNGTLPDGIYTSDTLIYYACRDDGPVDNEITLPATDPFYLFLYGNECQKVKNADVTMEWLKWDNERFTNMDRTESPHPVDERGPSTHKLFYCYYTPKTHVC